MKYNDGLPEFDLTKNPLSTVELDALRRRVLAMRSLASGQRAFLAGVMVGSLILPLIAGPLVQKMQLQNVVVWQILSLVISVVLLLWAKTQCRLVGAEVRLIESYMAGLQDDDSASAEEIAQLRDLDLMADLYVAQVVQMDRAMIRFEVDLLRKEAGLIQDMARLEGAETRPYYL